MDNPNQLLDDLVKALDSTYWSSWQTTAKFDKQLDAAREYVEKLNDAEAIIAQKDAEILDQCRLNGVAILHIK